MQFVPFSNKLQLKAVYTANSSETHLQQRNNRNDQNSTLQVKFYSVKTNKQKDRRMLLVALASQLTRTVSNQSGLELAAVTFNACNTVTDVTQSTS